MAELPPNLIPFEEQAQLYLKKGLVKEIEFSQSTYQVSIIDDATGKENWTFLQFDKNNNLMDCFCSHEDEEAFAPCVHLCAAYLQLFNGQKELLHQRFEHSIWNQLCFIYSERLGNSPKLLKRESKGVYSYTSLGGKPILTIEALTPESNKHLKNEILKRSTDTEETSLKFSNLSQEELKLWREGRPDAHLKYELSFWSDLAKWVMLKQEKGEEYTIAYAYAPNQLPNRITVCFTSLKLSFYISEATLIAIIPTLNSVKSELKTFHAPETAIAAIRYDKKEKCFIIIPKETKNNTSLEPNEKHAEATITCGRWLFQPHKGFYAIDPHPLLSQAKVYDIEHTLNTHLDLLKQRLVGAQIHPETIPISYALHFDANWDLHIASYIFSPGDLAIADSQMFGEWAYIDDDGFYHLEMSDFQQRETIIPERLVPHFIANHRSWLSTQKGFSLHLSGLESELTYNLSKDNILSFHPTTHYREKKKGSYEFDSWLYIPGEGFYAKKSSAMPIVSKTDLTWNEGQISLFIKMNQKELELISGFFSPISPVEHGKVTVEFHEKEKQLLIHPAYELKPAYQQRQVQFFDDFSYVPNEGFAEIPTAERLPEKYRHPVYIPKEQLFSFIEEELDVLEPHIGTLDKRLQKPDSIKLEIPFVEKTAEGRYLVKLKYETNIGSVHTTTLWKDIKKKQPYSLSSAGLIALHDKRFHWLRWLQKSQINHQQHLIDLSTVELLRVLAFEDVALDCPKRPKASTACLKNLMELQPPEAPNLQSLKSTLRPYQLTGIKWLWFLRTYGLSGLLCDDMGLGKTHQAMALIAAIKEERRAQKIRSQEDSPEGTAQPPLPDREAQLPFLVVCPTSVIYHWQEKLQQYLPEMKVYTFYGAERSLENFNAGYDLLLTSYGICRIENELLKQIPFDLAIFDEIQIAKNHNSRIYSALSTLTVQMRLGLTGTPIENHLRELKALFDLILPFYMPSDVEYREMFVKPIEKENSVKQTKLLERMIKPFVMRRKKEDVLLDLPDKIEELSHCDLSDEQVTLYNEVLLLGKARILEEMEHSEGRLPYLHIFALLSALKRICDHPALYLKCPKDYKAHASGKWDLFVELLAEARESGQKVVVYSQYLGMLDIIQYFLEESGIDFATIRGSTIDRTHELKRFHDDPKCEVFIGSLQAAGLGIDLTAASVVIHYDRWWNAARENQATDRVHRMGQKKGVQVFKLATKHTVEERIDELIRKKSALLDKIVTVDEEESIKQFTPSELMEFLKEVKFPRH